MITPYLDRHLIHNSALACFVLYDFIRHYPADESPHPLDLPKLLLVLPLVWHQDSRQALARHNQRSTLVAVLRAHPGVKIDLQARTRAHTATALQGLNLAVASSLIGLRHAQWRALQPRAPWGLRTALPAPMSKTSQQLAHWFATLSTPELYRLLFGIPYEVHP